MLENIFAGIIATIICSISIKIWEQFKNKTKQNKHSENKRLTLRYMKLVKIQFFSCFIYLFIVTIGLFFNWFSNDFVLTFVFATIFFVFIFLWGAFDAVFKPIKEIIENNKNEPSNKNPNGDK